MEVVRRRLDSDTCGDSDRSGAPSAGRPAKERIVRQHTIAPSVTGQSGRPSAGRMVRSGRRRYDPCLVPGCIVVVAYEGRRHLAQALNSCAEHAVGTPVVVVDNASTDGSSEMVRRDFPEAMLMPQVRNRGFAGGCNVGIQAARDRGAEWVLLLNQDAWLTAGAIEALVAYLETHPRAAAVQPAIMRPDGRCNSLGNPFHYLGFTVAGGNGQTIEEAERNPMLPWLRSGDWRGGTTIPAVSGAAMILRLAALDMVGDLEEELFLYHEDLDLSMRLRGAGWTLHLVGGVRVIHDHEFSRNPRKWYFVERNRHWVLFAHLRLRTLAILLLPLAGAEVAVLTLALRQGWMREKLEAYAYWAKPGNLRYLMRRRAEIAPLRRIGDAELLAPASVQFSPTEVASALTDRVFNPTSALIWRLLKPLVR